MIGNLPVFISVLFILTTLAALIFFYAVIIHSPLNNSAGSSRNIVSILCFWLVIQAIISLNDFYSSDTLTIPPKFLLAILPPFATILILFLTYRGRVFIDTLPLINITYLNVIRIPVELVLYFLFLNKAVPKLMTFEGKNFDILSGITSPFIAYYGFSKMKLSLKIILYWNILALILLINVMVMGILSAPFRFQVFSFLQPNTAVLHFPFIWLPSFIVPLVFFGHLVSIRQIIRSQKAVPDNLRND